MDGPQRVVKQSDIDEIVSLARALCQQHTHPLDLVLGIIEHESSFNAQAFRNDRNGGSYGLMQLDLATANDRGYEGDALGLYDAEQNIRLGLAQLDWIAHYLIRRVTGYTDDMMIAAYNEGVGNVVKGIEDQAYVDAVRAAARRWQNKLSPTGG